MYILAVICMFFFLACGSEFDKCAKGWPGFKQASVQNLTHKFGKYQDGDSVSVADCYLRYRGAVMYSSENWMVYEVFGSSSELSKAPESGEKLDDFVLLSRHFFPQYDSFFLLSKHFLPLGIERVNTAGVWRKNIRLGDGWITNAIIVQKISYWDYSERRCVTIE